MKFTLIKNLKYSKLDKSTIDLLATCAEYGEIPMTLNLVDTEDLHVYVDSKGKETPLEVYCKKQVIAPYVAPIVHITIPDKITMRQARLYLLNKDLLDDVESIVQKNKAWQIEWEYSSEILRSNQLISAIQESLQLTSTVVDEMFLEASKL